MVGRRIRLLIHDTDNFFKWGSHLIFGFPPCLVGEGLKNPCDKTLAPLLPIAGHDALYVAKVAPTSMISVPCKDGVSHNEAEDAKPEDLEAGCNVLLHAMLRMANAKECSPLHS